MDHALGKADKLGRLPSGVEVVDAVRKQQKDALLSFSLGKDSIATWLSIHGKFRRIVPYYLYTIPGLSFIEAALRYYEQKFDTRIYRYPHPSFYKQLDGGMFQHPVILPVIEAAGLSAGSYSDINAWCCDDARIDHDTYVATGVRAADSPVRRVAFTTHGVISHNKRIFYPVWDWTKQDVLDSLTLNRVALPVDYKIFGRSLDGFDLRFLLPIKQHYPDDYKRILDWFPFSDMEIARYEFALRKGYSNVRSVGGRRNILNADKVKRNGE
jgi:hypothetical protein